MIYINSALGVHDNVSIINGIMASACWFCGATGSLPRNEQPGCDDVFAFPIHY
ncbi:hypothetical protein [Mucilaginibacter sp. SP1R1]|uniref:hypothetical protein n=1 Tax=Mucilaginibacter sp. SP1R1 TaxID=2723091 RepID=UPI001C8656B5|nr:hypothetical protein [Mucilaginibacter sp. SP1R1]